MKKILILPSWYPNTIESQGFFFKEQAAFLNEKGFDIKILLAEELHTKSYLFQKLKRLITGQFRPLSKHFLVQEPEAFSFPVILQKSWTEKKKVKKIELGYLKAYKAFEKSLWKPDLIHVQANHKAGFGALEINKNYNIPFVIIEHAYYKINVFSKFKQIKLLEAYRKAHKVAGVSYSNKKRIIKDGVTRPVCVVWNLLDENKFELKTTLKSKFFIITCIARPDKVKDMNTFFKAVLKFLSTIEDISNIEINIIGHSSIEENKFVDMGIFDNLKNKEQILSTMKFSAFLTRDKIHELLQNSNVLVATSTSESFGVAIREAMLCGTPVISTKSGGPEDSINKDTGVLVDVGDFESIAYYLKKIKNKELTFDYIYIRNYIINQSGRAAFLNSMTQFYNT